MRTGTFDPRGGSSEAVGAEVVPTSVVRRGRPEDFLEVALFAERPAEASSRSSPATRIKIIQFTCPTPEAIVLVTTATATSHKKLVVPMWYRVPRFPG